ncbi:hypothetical protein HDU97_000123 [Phlyctochytrium planicorne]|nr:hypothetical protein HDU97_000123 [Phlyctochytrium planicorne]
MKAGSGAPGAPGGGRPRFQPPPQTNVLNLNPAGGVGAAPLMSPGVGSYPASRYNMPQSPNGLGSALKGSFASTGSVPYPSPPAQNSGNHHQSLYSEYGLQPSEVDSSSNRDSAEVREDARGMAQEYMVQNATNNHFHQDAPPSYDASGSNINQYRHPIDEKFVFEEDDDEAEVDSNAQDQTLAPVRFGVGMGHISSPTQATFTESTSPPLVPGTVSGSTNVGASFASPFVSPSSYDQQVSNGNGRNDAQQHSEQHLPQSFASPGTQPGNVYESGDWPQQAHYNKNQPMPMQRPQLSQEGQKPSRTMNDEDRWKGYPPPGDLIPEHQREMRHNADGNTGNRSFNGKPLRSDTPMTIESHQPANVEDLMAVIFSGYLLKQNRRGQFQKRLFRFDGLLLICLAPKRHKLPEHINLLTFDPARHTRSAVASEFMSALGRFYPTNPPMPALTNPLIASHNGDRSESSNPDIYTKYYHMPKWIIPTAAMLSVQSLVSPSMDPESKAARTFVIHTHNRNYVLRAPSAAEFRRWTFLLSRMSAIGGDSASVMAPTNGLGGLVRENDEDEEESDDEVEGRHVGPTSADMRMMEDLDLVQPPVVVDPSHPSLVRMGTWQKSVADLLGKDQDARASVLSVSNSEGTTTIERGLSNRLSRLTTSSMSEHQIIAPTQPMPPFPASLPQPQQPDSQQQPHQQMFQNQPVPSSPQQHQSQYQIPNSPQEQDFQRQQGQGFSPQYQPPSQQGTPQPSNFAQNSPGRIRSESLSSRARSDSNASARPMLGPLPPMPNLPNMPVSPRGGNYPMPVPLRPDQLQPPNGRQMKGPTIFGAAIAAGVHPTTPLMPGKDDRNGLQSLHSPSPTPSKQSFMQQPLSPQQLHQQSPFQQQLPQPPQHQEQPYNQHQQFQQLPPQPQQQPLVSDSPPLKKGSSIRQVNRTQERMSIISADGLAMPVGFGSRAPPAANGPAFSPMHSSPLANPSAGPEPRGLIGVAPEETFIALDPLSLQDLDRSCAAVIRILRRIQGDDSDESSPEAQTRRNPVSPLQVPSRSVPFPTPLMPPTLDFIHRFADVSIPHFTDSIAVHLNASGRTGLLSKFDAMAEEWRLKVIDRVVTCQDTAAARNLIVSRPVLEVFGKLIDLTEEVRKKVIGAQRG